MLQAFVCRHAQLLKASPQPTLPRLHADRVEDGRDDLDAERGHLRQAQRNEASIFKLTSRLRNFAVELMLIDICLTMPELL